MAPTKPTTIRIPQAIREAVDAWLVAHPGRELSEVMLTAICLYVGRPELVSEIRDRGRPVKPRVQPEES